MLIRDLLDAKGRTVYTVEQSEPLWAAVDRMVRLNVSSMMVTDGDGKIAGIVSERDVLRRCVHEGKDPRQEPVANFMTTRLIIVSPDDDLPSAEELMTRNRIRHLPVVDGRSLVGIISIGDVVKTHLSNARTENRYLLDYITAKYPA